MEKGLGLRVAQARRSAGFTQQQLCEVSGLSYSTLAKIERGAIKSPSVFTIQLISEALDLSLDSLLGIDTASSIKKPKKRSKSGVEFVYFDINGCLVRFYHRAFGAITDKTGVSTDIVESVFWQYNDLVCRGDLSLGDFNQILAEKFHVSSIDWGSFYLDAIEPINETAELIKWAHQHYRVGLLSNIMPGMIDKMFEKELIPNLPYDSVIDSSQTGHIKPEREIYTLAAEKTGVETESILLVDDSRANLMSAGKMGWRVMWFDDYHPEESVKRIKQVLEF